MTSESIMAPGPMTVLLKDAISPNLVQTLEHNPAFIHGGPFANIAHGCNSVIATKTALKLADYVVTEAGFGADLGAEKFFNIKCRSANLTPDVAVIVATVRALKMHGGVGKDDLGKENVKAVKDGCVNLSRHIENVRSFGIPVVIAINRFDADTDAEMAAIHQQTTIYDVGAVAVSNWAKGSEGAVELAEFVADLANRDKSRFTLSYPNEMPIWEKIETIATRIYRAEGISADQKTINQIKNLQDNGFGNLPVCIAKTQYSFSTNPNQKGAPTGFKLPIREIRLSAGAGFIVVICGDIMTMPGLPRVPAANYIKMNNEGEVEGLF